MDVHLIPGLGADSRLFGRLKLPGHTPHYHEWPVIGDRPALRDYAQELASRIDKSVRHVLIGVSMGGMVAQEMAAITHPLRTIIISSWKGPHEMPMHLRLLRGTHAEKLLTPAFMKRVMPVVRYQMGLETPEDIALFDAFTAAMPLAQLRIQIAAVLGWEGPVQPVQGLVHIHGDYDRLMPISPIKGAEVIRGGGHFMVFNRAIEVGSAVYKALSSI